MYARSKAKAATSEACETHQERNDRIDPKYARYSPSKEGIGRKHGDARLPACIVVVPALRDFHIPFAVPVCEGM